MESIDRIAESLPEPEQEVNKESAEMLKVLYEVGEKITGVITKLSEMSEKMNVINEDTEDTEVSEESEDIEIKEESED